MSYADEAALKAHILRVTRRGGDAVFDAEWPRMLAKAEQRMKYGAVYPVESPAIRIRQMEETASLTFTSGVASLPAGYLQAKSLTWGTVPPITPIYRTPEDFAGSFVYGGDGFPSMFTVEGDEIKIKPAASGTGSLIYYAAFPSATAGQNWLMANAPAIYEHGCLYEAYRFLRNSQEAERSIADYVSAVTGLMNTTNAAKQAGSLFPRIRHARVLR